MSSVFKIYSPEDCDFYYDGELLGYIEGNSKKAFRFEVERKGAYRLVFINSEYQTELMMKVSIDADEEREVELDFSEANEPAIRERERIINAIEHDYEPLQHVPEEIISAISNNGCITIPKGVRKIGESAFDCCYNLTSIIIPDSVTKIGDYAFSRCMNLTSFTVPNSVTAIGRGAFSGCKNLTSFTIPNSVTAIEEGVFSGCERLTAFYGKYAFHNNHCLIKDGVLLAFVPAPNDITKYTIPNSITAIGDSAFSGCCLTSITIPNSVTKIGDAAFRGCSNLTSIIIPDGVTAIGVSAFSNCETLTSITIPDSVTEILFSAFSNCESLTSITIPNSVTLIKEWAFIGCISLKSVYCKSAIPPKIGKFQLMPPFESKASDLKIYVPKSECSTVLESYKSAEVWKGYADIIEEYDYNNE